MSDCIYLSCDSLPLVRDIGFIRTTGDFNMGRLLDVNVFIYISEGGFEVSDHGNIFVLGRGDCFFLKKGFGYWDSICVMKGSTWHWIHFNDTEASSEAKNLNEFHSIANSQFFPPGAYKYRLTLPCILKLKNNTFIENKIKRLYETFDSQNSLKQLYLSAGVLDLFLDIYKLSMHENKADKSDVIVNKIISYLEMNYKSCILSHEIEKLLKMNYNYVSTVFKKKIGMSISNYHAQIRTNKAIQLLKDSSLNISEICYELGFENPSYFSRFFKKTTGITPSDYMKQFCTMI
jgi:AraC family transcriptional regulator of arabinose operon